MNHAYRLIWNDATGTWNVAPELARGRGKRGRTVRLGATALSALLFLPVANAQTLPSGGTVVHGQAGIGQSGSTLTVTQASRYAVIDWNGFSVGNGASARFDNGSGATLNRVTGALPSRIDGSLTATGALYLVNRNGVVVGADGVVNAGGFMATTLDVRDDEFMAGGAMRFFGDSRAGIVNLGSIHAASGNVSLVAHSVRNDGDIRAPHGMAELLAAQDIFLASPDTPAILVKAGGDAEAADGTGVANGGVIEAAQARMQAADGNLYALAINQAGIVRANGADLRDGRIVLTADGGTVLQDGTLSAQNGDGSGGTILVGGDYRGGNAAVANAARTVVTANANMDASATAAEGDGGRVIAWADDSTAFAGNVAARGGAQGGDGGFVEVSGKRTLDFRPGQPIDLSAAAGKAGTVLLDPDEIEVVASVSGANQIAASDIEDGLATGNYILDTSNFDPESGEGHIAVSDDLAWASASTLTLKSGNEIRIDADITAVDGTLELYTGRYAEQPPETDLPYVGDGAALDAGSTIEVATLRFGADDAGPPDGYTLETPAGTGSFWADGTLRVGTLEMDMSNGSTGLFAEGVLNAIGAFRTVGSGDIGYISLNDGEGDLRVFLDSTDSTGNGLQITTVGDLVLEAGSHLSYAAFPWTPDVVLASTGGNFINEAGDAVFGDNLRYLVYTGTQSGTVKDGLSGADEYSRSFAGNPPEDYDGDAISRFLFAGAEVAAPIDLTYRADDISRFYGDANPALTWSVFGLQPGDVLSDVVTGDPFLSTSATLQSGVGRYTIDISRGTLASVTYDFLFAPGQLTIEAAPLTLDIANARRYFGAGNPALSATVSGLKADDTAADILAGWTLSTSADRASDAGDYGIDASWIGTGSQNYVYTVNAGTLTIDPVPVTIALSPTFGTYGDALPDFRALATLSGAYNGDTVATAFPAAVFTATATPASSVGTYAVGASGFGNPNYLLTSMTLGDYSIGKATLVVNAADAFRFYGDPDPDFGVASITGWRNGDTLASIPGLVLTSNASGSSNVGSYAIVPSGSATNYSFVAGTGTLAIGKAPLDVFLGAATRYYGDADPAFTVAYEGLKNGETSLPGLYPVSNTNIYTPAGNYIVSAGGTTTFQNYLPTFYAGVLTIAPRPLLVTVGDAARAYGEPDPFFGVTVANATAWDAAQAAQFWIGASDTTERSDAGDYALTAIASPYGSGFDNLGSYAVSFVPGTLTIARAPLMVFATPVSIVWGDGLPPLAYTVSGFLPWDNADAIGGVRPTSQAGGTSVAPGQYLITLAGTDVGRNYTATMGSDAYVDVLRRQIFITGDYSAPFDALKDAHPGQIEPFTVQRYDSEGRLLMFDTSAPLAGGPQFSVYSSTDGTRGEGLGVYVSMPFVQPGEGYGMDDVLRYYDVVSTPGTALATTLTMHENVLHDFTPSAPPPVEVDRSSQTVDVEMQAPPVPPGDTPPLAYLANDMYPDNATLLDDLQALLALAGRSGPDADAAKAVVDAMPREFREYLNSAMNNESGWQAYAQLVADTEAWIVDLANARPRPDDYEALVANARADIARYQAEMEAMPSLDALRQKMASGDTETVRLLMPLITARLVKEQENGTLAPATQAALIRLINEQRAKTVASVDAKYDAFLEASKERGLVNIVSAPKIPDIVGAAYVEVSGEQMKQAAILGGGIAATAVTGAAIAGATLGIASMAVGGTTASLFSAVAVPLSGTAAGVYTAGAAGMAAVAVPAIVASVAVVIGVAEVVQIAESTKNYDRYMAYREANGQLDSLQGFDLGNPDNAMQMITAIGALMTESMAGVTP